MVLTFLNLVVVSGLLLGLITGSFQQYRESYSGEVIVASAEQRDYIENSPGLISFLESHSKINAIFPRYTVGGTVLGSIGKPVEKDERPNQISARVSGIDPVKEEAVTGFSRFVKYGENLDPNETGYILIGATLVKKYSAFATAGAGDSNQDRSFILLAVGGGYKRVYGRKRCQSSNV